METEGRLQPEERLRQRIRLMLSNAGLDQGHSDAVMDTLEKQITQLFANYAQAPDWKKDEVYAAGEANLLRTFKRSRLGAEG